MKTEELYQRLIDGVKTTISSEGWQAFLRVQARFHRYSFANTILIYAQMPEASRVAGFHTWKELGRFVKRGERGIRILAPIVKKAEESDRDRIVGFRAVTVFDVNQTDGRELPDVAGPKILIGEAQGIKLLVARLSQFAAELGLHLREEDISGGANGYYDGKNIVLKRGLPMNQKAKTLSHEIGHALDEDRTAAREEKETVAESVAFIVSAHFGLESDEYSFPYVAGWAGDLDLVKRVGEKVQRIAAKIIARIEGQTEEMAAS